MSTTGGTPPGDLRYWIWLNAVPGLLPQHHVRLLRAYGAPKAVLEASVNSLCEEGGVDRAFSDTFLKRRAEVEDLVEKEWKILADRGVTLLTLEDERYPQLMKPIFDPPMLLYVQGELFSKDGEGLAVVGSRKATPYGKLMAERLSEGVAERGVTIVSGMARGVDTSAHQAALGVGGRTVAVLGSGLAECYPPENRKLMDRIVKSGAVVSEFPFWTKPLPHHFPRRNRVISAMARGTLVVEAARDSGALITTDFALEHGRQVFAVPGPVGATNSQGTNRLIKQGATLVETAEDIFNEIPAWKTLKSSTVGQTGLFGESAVSEEARQAYGFLSGEPEHIDLLTRRSGWAVHRLAACLMELELSGLAKQFSGKLFARAK